MNRFDLDWAYIRRFSLVPALCVSFSAAILLLGIWLQSGQMQAYRELNSNYVAVHQDYDALVKQRRVVDRYHRNYQQFYDLGFIGRESRLDWVETLRATSTSLSIPRLNYAIDPQLGVIAPLNGLSANGDTQVRVSHLQLDMGLLHEVDLLRFFDALQSTAPGLISVDRCEMSYVGDARSRTIENLAATCAVKIFSIITSDVAMESR